MLKRSLFTCAITVSLSVGLGAEAQQSLTRESQGARETQVSTKGSMVHLEGCVFPERALSATEPVIVPARSVEDYILTDTKLIAGSGGATDGDHIFKLEQVAQDRLRALIGRRVGVTGRIDEEAERPAFRVTSIREIVGSCPRPPAPRS